MSTLFRIICVGILFTVQLCVSAKTEIKLWNRDADVPGMVEYVELFAELTVPEFGDYTLELSIPMEQGRAVKEMVKGDLVNLAIMGNDEQREKILRPIYYPLDKGLLGMRVCVVQRTKPDLFKPVRNLRDIYDNNLVIGSGSHWPDTPILISNGMPISVTPRYEGLMTMLQFNRFDCLLRSLNEVGAEKSRYDELDLVVETHIAFVYPLANILYVSPNSEALETRMRRGLQLAKEQHKLDEIYQRFFDNVIDEQAFFKRRMIFLENPNLTAKAREAINQNGLMSFEKASVEN